MQGPIYIHYGQHTKIGKRLFANFNLTIQDDTFVTIGNDCNFGPNVTIVTPIHPMLPEERNGIRMPDGSIKRMCYAKPVQIGDNCWFGASVTGLPRRYDWGKLRYWRGQRCHAGYPRQQLCRGVPCRVIRTIDESDSVLRMPALFDVAP